MRHIMCLADGVMKRSGLEAELFFLRLDPDASGSVHPVYRERLESEKSYLRFRSRGIVERNPRRNPYGPSGSQEQVDLLAIFYGPVRAADACNPDSDSNTDTPFTPRIDDLVEFRGERFEITKIYPIHPYGTDRQMGIVIEGRRFR